jgi:hypothetical protein
MVGIASPRPSPGLAALTSRDSIARAVMHSGALHVGP